jgi:tRNA 2-selenouridine synthase
MSAPVVRQTIRGMATVAEVGGFDAIIDARAPGEFAEDHLPGAVSMPVLDDEQRARVGTLYKQVSAFEAKKLGAALVSRNVADHIERHLLDKPKSWRPLVYCWRGGQRSGAFSHILREIGWDAHRLQGGYKAWRKHVIEQLARCRRVGFPRHQRRHRQRQEPPARSPRAPGRPGAAPGATGGAQGLGAGQPARRSAAGAEGLRIRSCLPLQGMDPGRPVFVEAESRKIGKLQVPDALLDAIRAAPGLRIEAALPARVEFLLRDYDYAVADPAWLLERLNHLKGLQSNETLERLARADRRRGLCALVEELLTRHYDPLYQRSQSHNYASFTPPRATPPTAWTTPALDALAAQILATSA